MFSLSQRGACVLRGCFKSDLPGCTLSSSISRANRMISKKTTIVGEVEELATSRSSHSNIVYPGISQKQVDLFRDTRVNFYKSLINYGGLGDLPMMNRRLEKAMDADYNLWNYVRSMLSIVMSEELAKSGDLSNNTHEDINNIYAIAMSYTLFELSATYFDDIVDGGKMRFDQPTWIHQNDGHVGATFDGLLIQIAAHLILTQQFGDKEWYANAQEAISDTIIGFCWGQLGDMLVTTKYANKRSELCTMDFYDAFIKIKNNPFFSAPIKLPLAMTKKYDKETIEQIEEVADHSGLFIQFVDDLWEVSKDTGVRGKAASDIRNGKFSVMFVTALELCNEKQRQILLENYGQNDSDKVEKILKVYEEVNVVEAMKNKIKQKINFLDECIVKIPNRAVQKVFSECVHTMNVWNC